MYFVPQHVQFTEAALLPLTVVDRIVPFWPASGMAYYCVFPFLLATFLSLDGLAQPMRFLYACLFAQTVGMLCFLVWPVTYPRELFPLPPGTSALGAALVTFCRSVDSPANCLPSLHVSTLALCVGALKGSRLFMPGVLLAIPLALSTLTFKQHYFVDVIAGLLLGLLAWRLFMRQDSAR